MVKLNELNNIHETLLENGLSCMNSATIKNKWKWKTISFIIFPFQYYIGVALEAFWVFFESVL